MSADPKRLNDLAAIASVAVAAILIGAKLAIWIATGSVAILGSLVDSGMDALASAVTFISVRRAAQPPDRAHRYGHGKAEAIAAFVQAGFVLGSAFFLANEAVRRLLSPQPLEQSALGIAVLLVASLLTAALLGFQRYVVRRTGSIAIRADSLHYRSDLGRVRTAAPEDRRAGSGRRGAGRPLRGRRGSGRVRQRSTRRAAGRW